MIQRKYFVSLGFLIFLILFNLSYFSNSGLLILGLKNSKRITSRNAHIFNEKVYGPLALSSFRMEQLLTNEECAAISKKVLADKILLRRNAAMSTIGTASYLDGGNSDSYILKSQQSNPHMIENYNDLLEIVIRYFRNKTNAKVEYRKNAALPGFHVFDCNNLFSMPVASVHKDLQFLRLKIDEDEDIDYDNTLSFTLCLKLPPKGGGLYTFDSLEMPPILHHLVPRPLLHSAAKKTKIEYKAGWIVTHEGQKYHMIAPCEPSKTKRITLQGHGIYSKKLNTWWLYW